MKIINSSILFLVRQRAEGSTVVIEAVNVPSPRTELLVRAENLPSQDPAISTSDNPPCYMCAIGLDVKHTDVLILSQFVRSDGCMLPRRITGLCRRQQKKIGKLVTMAQKAGLYRISTISLYYVLKNNLQ